MSYPAGGIWTPWPNDAKRDLMKVLPILVLETLRLPATAANSNSRLEIDGFKFLQSNK